MRLSQEKCHIFQSAKKVMTDSPGLVDFVIRLVIFVLNLPTVKCYFLGKFKLQNDCNPVNQKGFWG